MKAERRVWSMWSCWEEEQGSAVTPDVHDQGPDRRLRLTEGKSVRS